MFLVLLFRISWNLLLWNWTLKKLQIIKNYFISTGTIVNRSYVKCFLLKAILLKKNVIATISQSWNGSCEIFKSQLRNLLSLKLDLINGISMKWILWKLLLLKIYFVYLSFSLGFYQWKWAFSKLRLLTNFFRCIYMLPISWICVVPYSKCIFCFCKFEN